MFLTVRDRLVNTLSFGSGDPVLLAHGGFTGSSELWLQPFESLSRRWRVVTYDHRGSGENPASPDEISQEELIADLIGVMDVLELEHVVLAGESMGAGIALRAAIEHPDRFLGLILVDGSPVWERQRSEGFAAALRQDFDAALQGFVERCLPEPEIDHVRRWAMDILRRSTPAASARLVESMWGLNLLDQLPRVRQPALVIHGRDDVVVPLVAGQLIADGIPNSRMVVIDGCGHVPTLTFPDVVVAEISSFLEQVAASAA